MKMIEAKSSSDQRVVMVQMCRTEAMATVKGLMEQMLSNSPNVGRYESITDEGIDFSICVEQDNTAADLRKLQATTERAEFKQMIKDSGGQSDFLDQFEPLSGMPGG